MNRASIAKLYASIFKGVARKRIAVAAIILSSMLCASFLLTYSKTGETYSYKIGEIAKKNIRVPWDISYVKESESQLEKKRARDNEPLLFDLNRYVLLDFIQNVNHLFSEIDRLLESGAMTDRGDISVITSILNETLPENMRYDSRTYSAIITLKNRETLRKAIVRILNDVYSPGIIEVAYTNSLQIPNANVIVRSINDNGEYVEEGRTLESIETLASVTKKLPAICNNHTTEYPENVRNAVYSVVKSMIVQNMQFNADETLKRINDAAEKMQPVTGILKKDQIIVREGDSITTESLNLIHVLNSYTSTVNINYTIGVFLFQLIFLIIVILFIRDDYTIIFPNFKSFLITFIMVFFFFFYTYFIFRTSGYAEKNTLFPLYLPLPAILVVLTILFNIRLSLITSLYLFLYVMIICNGDYAVTAVIIATSFICIYGTKSLEKRIDFLVSGFALGLSHVVIIASIALMKKMTTDHFIRNVELALISGVANMIAAMGIFPFFEYLFKLTTRFKLLELADLNAPIFKEMLLKAPGTYNHSIMVGNMAEAACKEIHADSLLARVGSYFHDVGKLESPTIYIENKKEDSTVNLSPEEYSRRIINHVNFGISLAREQNLPESVIDFIREHHGTSVMSYFYHLALDVAHKSRKGHSVHPSTFSYPGPNPRTRESAIVMLADSMEAAARSIKEPTPDKIDALVKKIIHSKMGEGNLDLCPLTLKELTVIEKAFVNVLTGIYHTRIEYPEKDAIKSLENKIMQLNKQQSVSGSVGPQTQKVKTNAKEKSKKINSALQSLKRLKRH